MLGQWTSLNATIGCNSFFKVLCKTCNGMFYFLFHTSSAILWIKGLVSIYNPVKASTQKHPTNNIKWHVCYPILRQLYHMGYFLGDYYDVILSLPELVDFFQDNSQKNSSVDDLCKHHANRIMSKPMGGTKPIGVPLDLQNY